MSAGKIITWIVGGILVLLGVLFIIAAFGQTFNSGWLITGIILVGIGLVLVYLGVRMGQAAQAAQNVTLKVDLPANVNMDTLKCKACGGVLSEKDIKMVAGAPVVTCPYCGTTYQLTEEPKW